MPCSNPAPARGEHVPYGETPLTDSEALDLLAGVVNRPGGSGADHAAALYSALARTNRAVLEDDELPDWWGDMDPEDGAERCPTCGSDGICEQTREDQSPFGCLDCGEERIERPATVCDGDPGRVSV